MLGAIPPALADYEDVVVPDDGFRTTTMKFSLPAPTVHSFHPHRTMRRTGPWRIIGIVTDNADLSPTERAERGRSCRGVVGRASHGHWSPASSGRDPIALLERQELTRVPDLVPIRHERMAASPFAFFRGAALPMAADLATLPRLPLTVQLCGDAHLSNFGGFAAPDRDLVFDINDFDETSTGPFDWDLKRLAASFEIAGRSLNLNAAARRPIVEASARSYREAMREFARQSNLDVWYSRMDIDQVVARYGGQANREAMKRLRRNVAKAKSKDRLKATTKLTRTVDEHIEFISDPPLLVPIEELFDDSEAVNQTIRDALRAYGRTLNPDRRRLLDTYRYVGAARKVVGVGSVGTRAWVVLLIGRDAQDPLLLQVKEAEASVLEEFAGKSPVRDPRSTGGGGAAPHAGSGRHLPRLRPREGS